MPNWHRHTKEATLYSFYTLSDRKPAQSLQHVTCCMTELWYLAYNACRRAQNTVEASQSHRWQTSIERQTIDSCWQLDLLPAEQFKYLDSFAKRCLWRFHQQMWAFIFSYKAYKENRLVDSCAVDFNLEIFSTRYWLLSIKNAWHLNDKPTCWIMICTVYAFFQFT